MGVEFIPARLSGDVNGVLLANTVGAIQNVAVEAGTPTDGYVLTYVAADSMWEPQASAGGDFPIANDSQKAEWAATDANGDSYIYEDTNNTLQISNTSTDNFGINPSIKISDSLGAGFQVTHNEGGGAGMIYEGGYSALLTNLFVVTAGGMALQFGSETVFQVVTEGFYFLYLEQFEASVTESILLEANSGTGVIEFNGVSQFDNWSSGAPSTADGKIAITDSGGDTHYIQTFSSP